MQMQFANFEAALEYTGSWGIYQILFAALHQISVIAWCGNYAFMSFAILKPTWSCGYNISANVSSCAVLFECENLTVQKAPFHSIVEEWGLYCHHDYIPSLIITIQMVGALIGGQISGYMSDHFGRRRVLLVCYFFVVTLSMSSIFSHGWIPFAVVRFFVGFLLNAASGTVFTWGMELTTSNHNIIMNMCNMWQLWYMILALLAYLIADWRIYLIVINSVSILLLPAYYWFYESPRWLIQAGKLDEATQSINQMLRINEYWIRPNKKKPRVDVKSLESIEVDAKDQNYSILHLFSTGALAKYTSVLFLCLFTAGIVNNAFLYNLNRLGGNPFLDIFLYGLLRSWIPFAIYFMDKRFAWFGRRMLFLITLTSVIICLLVVVIAEAIGNALHASEAVTPAAVLSAVASSAIWVVTGQYLTELFPTLIRNIAVSFVSIGGEVGGIAAPQILYLQKFWPSLPFLTLEAVCVVCLVCGYFALPETKGRPLPDTLHRQQSSNHMLTDLPITMDSVDLNELINQDELNLEYGS